MMRDTLHIWRDLRILAAASVAMLSSKSAIAQISLDLQAKAQAAGNTRTTIAAPTAVPPKLPYCPRPCPSTSQSPPGTGHHTVTLSWKASTSAASANASHTPAGYCLYRRKKPGIPKDVLKCSDCELLNTIAFADTACVDDQVQDGTTYYYVVTFLVAPPPKTPMSLASNEAVAPIPPGQNAKSNASRYPLCWGGGSNPSELGGTPGAREKK